MVLRGCVKKERFRFGMSRHPRTSRMLHISVHDMVVYPRDPVLVDETELLFSLKVARQASHHTHPHVLAFLPFGNGRFFVISDLIGDCAQVYVLHTQVHTSIEIKL